MLRYTEIQYLYIFFVDFKVPAPCPPVYVFKPVKVYWLVDFL